jgi:branched-chain amino acid transport system ATP-binding protein
VRPFRGLTVLENVATAALFGANPAPNAHAAADRARAVLDEVGLGPLAKERAGSLTLSFQKKLEVARALATAPRLLLLDEIMAGLTPTEVQAMMATILEIKAQHGLTVLIIEHVMRALMDLSRHIVVLHHGEKIAEGRPAEIAANPAVQKAYLGDPSAQERGTA